MQREGEMNFFMHQWIVLSHRNRRSREIAKSMSEIRIYDVLAQRNNGHFLGIVHRISNSFTGHSSVLYHTPWCYSNNLASHPPTLTLNTNMHHPLKLKLHDALNHVVQTELEARAVFVGGRRRNRRKRKHRTGRDKKKSKKQDAKSTPIINKKHSDTLGDEQALIDSQYGSSATLSIDSGFADELPPLVDVVYDEKEDVKLSENSTGETITDALKDGSIDPGEQFDLELDDDLAIDDAAENDVFEENEPPNETRTLWAELEDAKERNLLQDEEKKECDEFMDEVSFFGGSMEDLKDDEENDDIIYSRLEEDTKDANYIFSGIQKGDLQMSPKLCLDQVNIRTQDESSPLFSCKSEEQPENGIACCTIL